MFELCTTTDDFVVSRHRRHHRRSGARLRRPRRREPDRRASVRSVRGAVPQTDERGHRGGRGGTTGGRRRPACVSPRADGPAARAQRRRGLVPILRQRPCLKDEFGDHIGRQSGDPPASNDRCARARFPTVQIMVSDHCLETPPPTMHELVGHTDIVNDHLGRRERSKRIALKCLRNCHRDHDHS